MKIEGDVHRLRIYVNESDRHDGRPLYEAIVRIARDSGLAGATAIRGIEGYGTNKRVHTVKVHRLSEDLPIVVEIIDRPERVAAFLPKLEELVDEGMATLERVRTVFFRRDEAGHGEEQDELQLESATYEPIPEWAPIEEPPMTETAQKVVDIAKQAAVDSRRGFPDSVDILRAMLCETNGIAERALRDLGIDCTVLERSFDDALSRDEPTKAFLGRFEKRSLAAARWLGDERVGTEHLLLAIAELRPSTATDTLMRLGAQPRDICREVLRIAGHEDEWQRWMADHPDM